MFSAIRSGVIFHVSVPCIRHSLTNAWRSLILEACEVVVLRRSVEFACAVLHACLSLCLKQCAESFLNATSYPKMTRDDVIGIRVSPNIIFTVSDPLGASDNNAQSPCP